MQVNSLKQNDLQTLDKAISVFINKKMVPALSTLVNEKVKFSSIMTNELRLDQISTIVPHSEFQENNVGVYIKCEGDVKLGILFHLSLEMAKKLASLLINDETKSSLSLQDKSSLSEIGNILAASLFNEINEITGYKIISSVPGLAINTSEVLLEAPIIESALSDTFVHTYGKLQCVSSQLIISISIFQDPIEAKKIIGYNYID